MYIAFTYVHLNAVHAVHVVPVYTLVGFHFVNTLMFVLVLKTLVAFHSIVPTVFIVLYL